jgi:UDP-N-acetylmuramate--alanine ligase
MELQCTVFMTPYALIYQNSIIFENKKLRKLNIQDYKNIYFLGIGGIGMSAIARWFKAQGFNVGGYDKTQTPLTIALENEGLDIHYDDKVGRIPSVFYRKHETLVIRTPAVPKDNVELKFFEDDRYKLLKRSEILGLITENLITIAVAGTHGKTTTSSMIAHILKNAGYNISAFLGGITTNYETNLLIGNNLDKNTPHLCVVEADEFDRSFLTLHPDIAVVTSMDADHLDIYGEHDQLLKSFSDFINQIKIKGHLVIKNELPFTLKHDKLIYIHEYQEVKQANLNQKEAKFPFSANNIRIENHQYVFDYVAKTKAIEGINMQIPGFHNIENAVAAINTCILLEVSPTQIKAGLESFKGVKRRFETVLRTEKTIYIDDYAHHPTEITAFLSSVKTLYPDKKLTCIFQPHLFSRTRDFMDGFAESLSIADELILMDIYPARELPIAGITSEVIFEKISCNQKTLTTKAELMNIVTQLSPEVLVTVGAGDIDTFVSPLKKWLEESK